MSVTFFIPNAPTEVVHPYADEPDYTETVPVAPYFDINVSNSNAVALLTILDPGADVSRGLVGKWSGDKLHYVLKRTLKALNIESCTKGLLFDGYQDGNFVYCGRDQDYMTRRLTAFAQLLQLAIKNGEEVCYG